MLFPIVFLDSKGRYLSHFHSRVKFFHKDDYDYNAYGKYSDDSGDEIDLPIRTDHKPQQFVEADIQDGDTLQAISLRFNCSVSQYKILSFSDLCVIYFSIHKLCQYI